MRKENGRGGMKRGGKTGWRETEESQTSKQISDNAVSTVANR